MSGFFHGDHPAADFLSLADNARHDYIPEKVLIDPGINKYLPCLLETVAYGFQGEKVISQLVSY